MDLETKQVLQSILLMLKDQAIYLHRQHGWVIAASETIEKHPDLASELKAHPFYDLGPRPDVQITNATIQHIDALIQRLKG